MKKLLLFSLLLSSAVITPVFAKKTTPVEKIQQYVSLTDDLIEYTTLNLAVEQVELDEEGIALLAACGLTPSIIENNKDLTPEVLSTITTKSYELFNSPLDATTFETINSELAEVEEMLTDLTTVKNKIETGKALITQNIKTSDLHYFKDQLADITELEQEVQNLRNFYLFSKAALVGQKKAAEELVKTSAQQ